jgi:hypothetical protein
MAEGIMAPGYSLAFEHRRIERELRQARAAELEWATRLERKRIEQEIKAEANRQVDKLRADLGFTFETNVLWML